MYEKLASMDAMMEKEGPGAGIELLRQQGYLSVCLPERWGGRGWEISPAGMLPMLELLREIGRGSLAVGRIYEGHVNALRLIHSFGTAEQKSRWSGDALDGCCFGIWNTGRPEEDVKFVKGQDGKIFLEGAKVFASGAEWVDRPIISAKNFDGGSQLLVIAPAGSGLEFDRTTWDPMGMAGSVSHRLDVTGVEVFTEMLLGQPDCYARQPWLSGGAMRFAAVQLGGAEALLEITRQHLRATGRTDHAYQEERVSKMLTDCESGRLWLGGAAERAEAAESEPERLVHYVGMMRSAIEGICFRTIQRAHQCVGLQGMLRPHAMERVSRDLMTYLRQPNPDGSLMGAGRYALGIAEPLESLWKGKKE